MGSTFPPYLSFLSVPPNTQKVNLKVDGSAKEGLKIHPSHYGITKGG